MPIPCYEEPEYPEIPPFEGEWECISDYPGPGKRP
jgi:hypothetical protein